MNREQVIKLEIQEQLQKIGGDLAGYKVVLFGSRASGRACSRADFDVGIIGDHPIPLATFYRIADMLAAIDTLACLRATHRQAQLVVDRRNALCC